MYLNVAQYPALRGKSKTDQRAIVLAALRRHERWINKRIFLIICVLLGLAGGVAQMAQRFLAAEWIIWAILIAAAALFYGYILWEINGPVLRAVQR